MRQQHQFDPVFLDPYMGASTGNLFGEDLSWDDFVGDCMGAASPVAPVKKSNTTALVILGFACVGIGMMLGVPVGVAIGRSSR